MKKTEVRELLKAKRRDMSKEHVCKWGKCCQEVFLNSDLYKNSKVLMLYLPLGNETDTNIILNRAFRDAKRVILPLTDEKTGVITPVEVYETTTYHRGAFNISEPDSFKVADKLKIDTVLIPGVAFDKFGARVGFGKGCYDRFLQNTTALKIGFCYSFQLLDKIETDRHDIMVDCIITERGCFNVI